MKKFLSFFICSALACFLIGCGSAKQIAYFQNADSISYAASKGMFDAHIMPKDLLTITVSTTDPLAAKPFNLSISQTLGTSNSLSQNAVTLLQYLVDNEGYINFPVVGKIYVKGLTKRECESIITEKISKYMATDQAPIVTVKMASFKVSVLGEVKSPGIFSVSQEKISVMEALARAGDLTIYGKRTNVLLIREDETGEKHLVRLNLNDANLINSDYYYLQQNDVLYIEPNGTQARNSAIGSSTTIWITLTSTLISLSALIVNILR